MSRDDGDRPERERLSWREIDQRRDKPRSTQQQGPRGAAARERSAAATKEYLKQLDGMFSKARGGADGERLTRAMREAHGTPKLAEACRAYRDQLGMPSDAQLLSLFLDSGDPELVLAGLEALRDGLESGALQAGSGLRTQLRTLALDSNDAVAEAAEELLPRL